MTLCNLLCGCGAVIAAANLHFTVSLTLIVLGCLFDFCDGFAARLLRVSSKLGVELDSLADVVTSGVAPAMMLHYFLRGEVAAGGEWIAYVPLLIAAFAAYRLAKFNIDERQHTGFLGLPTPANALFWASLIVSGLRLPVWLYVVLILCACVLMVSEIPMLALKFRNGRWSDNWLRYLFLLVCLVLLLLLKIGGLALCVVWYVVLSLTSYRNSQ